MRDRLVGRRAQLAAQAARAGSKRDECSQRSPRSRGRPPASAASSARGVGAPTGRSRRWLLSGDGLSAMSEMLMPARPSVSAMSAMTPGRLGTATRSSRGRRRRQPGLEQRAAPARRPRACQAVEVGRPRAAARGRACERGDRAVERVGERVAVGGVDARPTAPGWRRRRAWRRGSSGRSAGGRSPPSASGGLGDEDVGDDVRQVARRRPSRGRGRRRR